MWAAQGPVWVAGMAAECSGEVDRSGPASHPPMTRLRRQAMLGPAPVRIWEAPSAARTGWGASATHSAIAVIDRAPTGTLALAWRGCPVAGWRGLLPLSRPSRRSLTLENGTPWTSPPIR
jgi:hypothetical protein